MSNNNYERLITKKDVYRVANERLYYLFSLAFQTGDERYIDLMERIGRRMDITLPQDIKRMYCKKCKKPYKNVRVRLKKNVITVTCLECGDIRRFQINR
uniref:Ribonuclease P protein component 4 n=1 Tax=Thermoplasma volcanium (strain ATCC 51530 / DSM 4299 / JCM 9571 / NBRC 15438 / GSS1) TaxID=273116 RepID=RNP4_THEVO|nr:RecName: Full=Ribonuclease P protein component 4; Short=RNase P component 4; AltName: Full=Rpp21 [Thermoplasma volcanium GSS1]